MGNKTEKISKEKMLKKDKHNMITLAIATVILAIVSVIATIFLSSINIVYILPAYLLTILFGIFLILSIITVRKHKNSITNE